MFYIFDSKEKVIGVIPRKNALEAYTEEPLRGIIKLSATLKYNSKKVNEAYYIGHVDAVNKEDFQMYRIYSEVSEDDIKIEAVHVAFDDLNYDGYVRERRLVKASVAVAMSVALSGSRWKVGKVFSNKVADVYFYDNSRAECITKILDAYDVELGFRLEFKDNKIINRYVDIYDRRGRKTGKRYAYGHKALSVTKEKLSSNLVTAIIPRGKGEEKFDESGNSTGGFGRRIDIKDVVWSKRNENPVDKPKGQEYVEIPEMTDIYGFSDGSPRIKVEIFQDIEDPKLLLEAAYKKLVELSRPQVEFSSTIKDMGELDLGDEIVIIRKDLGIYYSTRIFKFKRNLLDNSKSEIELGDNLDKVVSSYDNLIKREVESLNKDLTARIDVNITDIRNQLTNSMFDDDANWYFLRIGNRYNAPAGFYTFDKPIDQQPSKGLWIGSGKMAIANKKAGDGSLIWSTWATGDGLIADAITSGIMQANLIKGGQFSDLSGNFFLDMETGAMNIGNVITYDPTTKNFRISLLDDLKAQMELKVGKGEVISAINLSPESARIQGRNIILDGRTQVNGDFSVSGSSLFGTIDAESITVKNLNADNLTRGTTRTPYSYGKMENGDYDYELRGNSVAFNGNSGYITIKDTGGRGQVDINGTVAARGSGYVYELNRGGLTGPAGNMIGQSWEGTSLKGPGMESPSITIDSSGVVRIGRLFVNGKEITG